MKKKTIIAIKDFITTAEQSIKNAKKLLSEIIKEENIPIRDLEIDTSWLSSYKNNNDKIIEWVFSWEYMIWADWNKYPVPANYASKSKLVQWDKLKLTIEWNWKMIYKQIEPIERETKIWLVAKNWNKFQVIIDWNSYNLLTAAVTHFKAEIWDSISVLLPKNKEATYAAIDMLIPKE